MAAQSGREGDGTLPGLGNGTIEGGWGRKDEGHCQIHFRPAERLQPTSRTTAAAKPSPNQSMQLVSAQPNTVNKIVQETKSGLYFCWGEFISPLHASP